MIGVLVLVHQDVPESPPVVLGHIGEGLQDIDGRHDQVVEVKRVSLPQSALVGAVGLRE